MKAKNELNQSVLNAYADCNGTEAERNLNFLATEPVSAAELQILMRAAVPEGYNGFDPLISVDNLVACFGDKAQYFVAREGSVCIYIKPTFGNLWLRDLNDIHADEILFCPKKQMFRVWWD